MRAKNLDPIASCALFYLPRNPSGPVRKCRTAAGTRHPQATALEAAGTSVAINASGARPSRLAPTPLRFMAKLKVRGRRETAYRTAMPE